MKTERKIYTLDTILEGFVYDSEEGKKAREEEIINQIEGHDWDYLEIEGFEITALIKGEQK